jgi:hypothetical protein
MRTISFVRVMSLRERERAINLKLENQRRRDWSGVRIATVGVIGTAVSVY